MANFLIYQDIKKDNVQQVVLNGQHYTGYMIHKLPTLPNMVQRISISPLGKPSHIPGSGSLQGAVRRAITADKENQPANGLHVGFQANGQFFYLNKNVRPGDTTFMCLNEVMSAGVMSNVGRRLRMDRVTKSKLKRMKQEERSSIRFPYNRDYFELGEYQQDYLAYFRSIEKRNRPSAFYMDDQPEINQSMRATVVDWLSVVALWFKFETETIYLAVSFMDRYFSEMAVVTDRLQLVGTTSLYIAAKYEEVTAPTVTEIVHIMDHTYDKQQVLRMERLILQKLNFDLVVPTPYRYIGTYAVLLSEMTDSVKFLAEYICELTLLAGDPYLRFYPSLISAAAVALARYLLGLHMWNPELCQLTTYRLVDMKDVVLHLSFTHETAAELIQQTIRNKYMAMRYKYVSAVEPIPLTRENFDEIVRTLSLFCSC